MLAVLSCLQANILLRWWVQITESFWRRGSVGCQSEQRILITHFEDGGQPIVSGSQLHQQKAVSQASVPHVQHRKRQKKQWPVLDDWIWACWSASGR
jgi:hypothetical protein